MAEGIGGIGNDRRFANPLFNIHPLYSFALRRYLRSFGFSHPAAPSRGRKEIVELLGVVV